MRRYLLDTGAASDWMFRRGQLENRVRAVVQAGARVGICTPVLGELWAGVKHSQSQARNEQRLVHALKRLVVWPYDNASAEAFGLIYAELRRIGRPMQQIDIQIGAVALTLGDCIVISSDSDLSAYSWACG